MNTSRHLFFLMNHIFYGFGLSLLLGAISSGAIWVIRGTSQFQLYSEAFFVDFNCFLTGGLVFSTAFLIFKSQTWIPETIEGVFDGEHLQNTEYEQQKNRYLSASRSISFATIFIVISFTIFQFSRFPFEGIAEGFLIGFACIQYGLGVYIGRKLFYIAQMLHAIENVEIDEDIFKEDRLGLISTYVNTISTLTVILVFAAVWSHYYGPFNYDSLLGENMKLAHLLPAIVAIPVITLFNFYPRTVLKSLYARSISNQVNLIKKRLKNEKISEFERLSYLIEYDKMSKDELKYRLRVTLSDLPIAITVILMVVGFLVN